MIFPKKENLKRANNRGFALLIGVLVSAILISVAYSMFSVTLNQSILSIAGKESQKAFYMADTGLECAQYADQKIDEFFATIEISSLNIPSLKKSSKITSDLFCNTEIGKVESFTSDFYGSLEVDDISRNNVVFSSFKLLAQKPNDPSCAMVYVYKYVLTDGGVYKVMTEIESRGYNTCTNPNDPQRLERGLEVEY